MRSQPVPAGRVRRVRDGSGVGRWGGSHARAPMYLVGGDVVLLLIRHAFENVEVATWPGSRTAIAATESSRMTMLSALRVRRAAC